MQRILPLGIPLSEKSLFTTVSALSSVEFVNAPTFRDVSTWFCSRVRFFLLTPSLLLVPEATICCLQALQAPRAAGGRELRLSLTLSALPSAPLLYPLLHQGLRCPHSSYLGSSRLTPPVPHAWFCLVFGEENLVLQAHSEPLYLSLLRFLYVDWGALGTLERAE